MEIEVRFKADSAPSNVMSYVTSLGYQLVKFPRKSEQVSIRFKSSESMIPFLKELHTTNMRVEYWVGEEKKTLWEIFPCSGCRIERTYTSNKDTFCFLTDNNDFSYIGCRKNAPKGIFVQYDHRLFEIGKWTRRIPLIGKKVWEFNKEEMKEFLRKENPRLDICPHYKKGFYEAFIDYLPKYADPTSNDWGYSRIYPEMMGEKHLSKKDCLKIKINECGGDPYFDEIIYNYGVVLKRTHHLIKPLLKALQLVDPTNKDMIKFIKKMKYDLSV